MIDQILEEDQGVPKKQRHTAKRIYERLRDEHGFPGKYTIVKDYVPGTPSSDPRDVRTTVPFPEDMPSVTLAKRGWSSVERSRRSTTWPWTFLTAMGAM